MEIKSISVLIEKGRTDEIIIYLNHCSYSFFKPFNDGDIIQPTAIKFEVHQGEGIEYVKEHFNKEPNIINLN